MPQPPSPRCVRPEGCGQGSLGQPIIRAPVSSNLTCLPLFPSALMTGHSAVLGAGVQEQNYSASSKLLPSDISPKEPSQGQVHCVPCSQSFWRSRGHSDLQRQLEEEKVEEPGRGNSAWAGGSGCGVAVQVPPRERQVPPGRRGLRAPW